MPPLELHVDLLPRVLSLVAKRDEAVVCADRKQHDNNEDDNEQQTDHWSAPVD